MYFNHELFDFQSSIKKIKFYYDGIYDKELNNLPKNIEEIYLTSKYNKKIHNVPLNLKKIFCHEKYKFINDFDCGMIAYL